MGLTITSLVQGYISKERMARVLGRGDRNGLAKATVFGAASSGCSFGAVAIGKGLFKKGAHAVNFLAFMFASTNLIVELGLTILILLGWEFLVAELLGGLILIAVMAVIIHVGRNRGFAEINISTECCVFRCILKHRISTATRLNGRVVRQSS